MSTEENKALVRHYFEELNKGNLDVIDETFSTNFVNQDSSNPEVRSIEEYKQWLVEMKTAFPDAHWTVEDPIAEGDKVVVRDTFQGTHQGLWLDIDPTGRQVTVTSIHFFRIQDGKIVENRRASLRPQSTAIRTVPRRPGCGSDAECPDGFVCRNGACEPA
jgi:steroid delta-isomerase-like uncharacterized protein